MPNYKELKEAINTTKSIEILSKYSERWNVDFGYCNNGAFLFVRDNLRIDVIVYYSRGKTSFSFKNTEEDINVQVEYTFDDLFETSPDEIVKVLKDKYNVEMMNKARKEKVSKMIVYPIFNEVVNRGYDFISRKHNYWFSFGNGEGELVFMEGVKNEDGTNTIYIQYDVINPIHICGKEVDDVIKTLCKFFDCIKKGIKKKQIVDKLRNENGVNISLEETV